MFLVLGLIILIASFAIAAFTLILEQKRISKDIQQDQLRKDYQSLSQAGKEDIDSAVYPDHEARLRLEETLKAEMAAQVERQQVEETAPRVKQAESKDEKETLKQTEPFPWEKVQPSQQNFRSSSNLNRKVVTFRLSDLSNTGKLNSSDDEN